MEISNKTKIDHKILIFRNNDSKTLLLFLFWAY